MHDCGNSIFCIVQQTNHMTSFTQNYYKIFNLFQDRPTFFQREIPKITKKSNHIEKIDFELLKSNSSPPSRTDELGSFALMDGT